MIPVTPAAEPEHFDVHVRRRGEVAIQRLCGQPVHAPGRKPRDTWAEPAQIPAGKFPEYWREVRQVDGRSTLDDLMDAYAQRCAYLAMRIERATGSPSVDHFVPKERDWRLVYEWSNYRLSAGCINGAKQTREIVDPFKVQPGWFALDLDTFYVRRGDNAPPLEHERIEETLHLLNLRQCVAQRGEYITLYRSGALSLSHISIYAPFIASEIRRQRQELENRP